MERKINKLVLSLEKPIKGEFCVQLTRDKAIKKGRGLIGEHTKTQNLEDSYRELKEKYEALLYTPGNPSYQDAQKHFQKMQSTD